MKPKTVPAPHRAVPSPARAGLRGLPRWVETHRNILGISPDFPDTPGLVGETARAAAGAPRRDIRSIGRRTGRHVTQPRPHRHAQHPTWRGPDHQSARRVRPLLAHTRQGSSHHGFRPRRDVEMESKDGKEQPKSTAWTAYLWPVLSRNSDGRQDFRRLLAQARDPQCHDLAALQIALRGLAHADARGRAGRDHIPRLQAHELAAI